MVVENILNAFVLTGVFMAVCLVIIFTLFLIKTKEDPITDLSDTESSIKIYTSLGTALSLVIPSLVVYSIDKGRVVDAIIGIVFFLIFISIMGIRIYFLNRKIYRLKRDLGMIGSQKET